MEPLQIDQLPDLCMRKIFKYFSVRELVRCRTVCRLFKFYADQAKPLELVVYMADRQKAKKPNFWYLTNRPVEIEDSISWKELSSIWPSRFAQLFQQLKFLSVCANSPDCELDLGFSNHFKELIQLEFRSPSSTRLTGQNELVLPRLRVLSLQNVTYSSLVLKTPLLEVLRCYYAGVVELECPENLKQLETDHLSEMALQKFKNLDVFTVACSFIVHPSLSLNHTLSACKHLKEVYFDLKRFEYYDRLRFFMEHLLLQKRYMESSQKFKVYLSDIQLLDESQLEDLGRLKSPLRFQLKNYKLLRSGFHSKAVHLNYSDLMSWHTELSGDFFDKFPSIRTVKASGSIDPDQFKWFLKNADQLRRLTLTGTSLGQQFLDSLPSLNDRLSYLKISESPDSVTNFDFILNLENLTEFKTEQQFEEPFDLAAKKFRKSEIFDKFQYRENTCETVDILRVPRYKDQFDLICYEKKETIFYHLKETYLSWIKLAEIYEQWKKKAPSQKA